MERTSKNRGHVSLKRKLIIISLSLFFFILLIATLFGKKGLIEIYRTQKRHKALLQEIEHLENKKKELEREIEELKTNPKSVEKKARERLWMSKPDEIVIIKKEK